MRGQWSTAGARSAGGRGRGMRAVTVNRTLQCTGCLNGLRVDSRVWGCGRQEEGFCARTDWRGGEHGGIGGMGAVRSGELVVGWREGAGLELGC